MLFPQALYGSKLPLRLSESIPLTGLAEPRESPWQLLISD